MIPYQDVKYHLPQWAEASADAPQNYQELYNLRHAVIRSSAAECGLGLFKGRWRRFKTQTTAKASVMSNMVVAASHLHNFCIDSKHSSGEHPDVLDAQVLNELRTEFAAALQSMGQTASDHSVDEDTVPPQDDAPQQEHWYNLDSDPHDVEGIADTNCLRVRDEIACMGWREYEEALKDTSSFASLEEGERTALLGSVHEAAHAIAAGTPAALQ
eukprot:m.29103 g.29103  ORF g.29103 m.29103 type:complete len:214 (-) comp11923_c0_seq1:21-662(-)